MRLFAGLCLIFLTACVDRAVIPFSAEALSSDSAVLSRIFVATNRQQDGNRFGIQRASAMSFMDVSVSIPADRRVGSVRTAIGTIDPERHFTIAERRDIDGATGFTQALSRALAEQPDNRREVIIFTHGYNNSFSDGVFRMAQIMHDFQVPAIAVHFSWPSAFNPLGYVHDRDAVLAARDDFEDLLNAVRASGADEILLVGHSMGTLLIMETLRQIEISEPGWSDRNLSGVVLISPDISVDLFNGQADRFAALPEPFAIFVSHRDRALALSARLTGQRERLGAISDPDDIAHLPVTILDVSAFDDGQLGNHFTVGTSPTLISLITQGAQVDEAFQNDRSGRSGLLPGTVITVQNATQLVLSPNLMMQN